MVQHNVPGMTNTFIQKRSFSNGIFLDEGVVNPSDITRARNAKEKLSHLFPQIPSFLRMSTKLLCFHSVLHHQINEISNSIVLLILIHNVQTTHVSYPLHCQLLAKSHVHLDLSCIHYHAEITRPDHPRHLYFEERMSA